MCHPSCPTPTPPHRRSHQISEEDSGEGGMSAEDSQQQRQELEEKLRQLREAELMVQRLEEETKSKGESPLQQIHTHAHSHTTHTNTHTHTHTRTHTQVMWMHRHTLMQVLLTQSCLCFQLTSCLLQMTIHLT